MKTSTNPTPPFPPNISRPAAFLAVKQAIMNAKDRTDLVQARKAIDNYIYGPCEKPLRHERQLYLIHIYNWQIGQLREKGIDTPDPQTMEAQEDDL